MDRTWASELRLALWPGSTPRYDPSGKFASLKDRLVLDVGVELGRTLEKWASLQPTTRSESTLDEERVASGPKI